MHFLQSSKLASSSEVMSCSITCEACGSHDRLGKSGSKDETNSARNLLRKGSCSAASCAHMACEPSFVRMRLATLGPLGSDSRLGRLALAFADRRVGRGALSSPGGGPSVGDRCSESFNVCPG